MTENVIIMGAAGRDFHVFNTYFRDNDAYHVVAFTAAQIPDIDGRKYPAVLAGSLYPDGIDIYDEEDLDSLIKEHEVSQVIFAYSDLSHQEMMHKASKVIAAGADFRLMGPNNTSIQSKKPMIAVTAVRTGVGKSQATIKVSEILQSMGLKVVAIRHPMPYGNLADQAVQRFETYEDLDRHNCTIEEREEYEPHIERGLVIYAGVDYGAIIEEAEKEADVILWDGGNNDFSFYHPDLNIVMVDPHRPGHELAYHPGEANLHMADVVIINKVETADAADIETVRQNVQENNPDAIIVDAASPITVNNFDQIRGKRVLVIEDGPTLTHGGSSYGAGSIAAQKYGAAEIIDPRPYAVGSIKDTFKKYSHLDKVLPAMGYGDQQIKDLEATINAADVDLVISGTPTDISRVVDINKPVLRVQYGLQEIGQPDLTSILKDFVNNMEI